MDNNELICEYSDLPSLFSYMTEEQKIELVEAKKLEKPVEVDCTPDEVLPPTPVQGVSTLTPYILCDIINKENGL